MLFRMTMPGDAQLVPALRQVAERVAQCAGYAATDAARVAASVGHAATTVIERLQGESAEPQLLDIRFQREGVHLDVWLFYPTSDGDRTVLDPAVSGEALRQGMESVEFGRDGDTTYCRLRRMLPRDKVDHRCEMPPK